MIESDNIPDSKREPVEKLDRLIHVLHLEDLQNDLHPSVFDENEGYDMLIVRLPRIDADLNVQSIGFVITDEESYLYDKAAKQLVLLESRFEGPHTYLDKLADALLKSFGTYQERIADMEEMLYADRKSEHFMTNWLGLKRDILRIERIMTRAVETMQDLIERYESDGGFPLNHYVDLHEHMDRITRSATLQLSKLDYLYNFHNARTNEKMNKMIYLLTIISAVFLPLNLVVGFFGMNTSGLPFTEGAAGTAGAVTVMLVLVVVTSLVVMLWRKRVET